MSNILVKDIEYNSFLEANALNNSEDFLQELTEDDLLSTKGGWVPTLIHVVAVVAVASFAAGAVAGAASCKM